MQPIQIAAKCAFRGCCFVPLDFINRLFRERNMFNIIGKMTGKKRLVFFTAACVLVAALFALGGMRLFFTPRYTVRLDDALFER